MSRFPDHVKTVQNDFANPEAATDLTGWAGTSLARIASDSDFGTSCAELPAVTGTGTITIAGFRCLANQICFIRAKLKKTGAGNLRITLSFKDSAGGDLGSYHVATRAATAGVVYDLEGFKQAPANSVTVDVVLTLLSGSSSTLRATKVQVVANARDDVPVYVTSPQAVSVSAYSPNGYADNGLANGWIDPSRHARLLHEFGADWTRGGPNYLDFTAPVTNWDATNIAPYMEALAAAGIKLVYVMGIPDYLNAGSGDTSLETLSSSDYAALAAFHASFVAHWPGVVGAVEWYNEPNLGNFWGVGSPDGNLSVPDADKYTAALKVLYPAIKAVADIPVLAGCMAPQTSDQDTPAPASRRLDTWINAMYAAGAKGYMDAVSFHPYPLAVTTATVSPNLGMDTAFSEVRQAISDAGDDIPMWITEIGLATSASVTEEHQQIAMKLMRGYCQRQPDVEGVFLYTWGRVPMDSYAFMDLTSGYRREIVSALAAR